MSARAQEHDHAFADSLATRPLEVMFFETLVVPWGVTRKSRVPQLSSSGLTCKSYVWLLLVSDVVVAGG